MTDMDAKDSIREILEHAGSANPDKNDSGSVEFEFTERSGVVFETDGGTSDIEPTVAVVNEEALSEQPTVAEDTVAPVEDTDTELVISDGISTDTTVSSDEFELPDIFDIEEKSEELLREEAAGIWTTYVPRFTEVSENYRMRSASQTAGGASNVRVEASEDMTDSVEVDPTAEVDGVAEAITVSTAESTKPADDERKTVYIFSNRKNEEQKPKIRTLEDEVREIDELMTLPNEDSLEQEGTSEQKPDEPAESAQQEQAAETETQAQTSTDGQNVSTISDSLIREANIDVVQRREPTEQAIAAPAPDESKPRRSEFSAPPQRDSFKDRFLDQLLSIRVRLIAAIALTVLILLFENLNVLGVDLFAALKIPKYTGVPALLDLELAICIFVLALPEMISAVINLFRGKVSSEISVILSLVVLSVYSITAFSLKLADYALFGFLFAVHVDAAIFAAYLKKSTDFSSFKIISNKEKKKALVITRTKEMPMENIALDGAVDEYKSKTVSVVRTAFVTDFFKRCGSVAEKTSTTLIMMGISIGSALVCGAVSYFLNGGIVAFITSSSLVFLMAMPAFSVLTNKFVYAHAAGVSKKEGCAIIGQGALLEYADADVMIFEDTEIFGEEDVKLRNDFTGDTVKGTRQMYAIFSAVGGPLEKKFASALDKKCSAATNIAVSFDGIAGDFEGHRILAGNEAYMKRFGATFANESVKIKASGADSTRIMYAAEDGVIYAGFRISYSFSEGFAMILPALKEAKIVPLINTRDPNINNELMKILTIGGDSIRVFKRDDLASHTERIERRTGAGIVTVGEKSSAIYAMLLSKKSAALSSRLALTEVMAVAVGAALGAALSLSGMSEAPTAALGMWQLLWCIGVGFLSYREYRDEQ